MTDPIHKAVLANNIDKVKELINEVPININRVCVNHGRLPLHYAMKKGHAELVCYLSPITNDIHARDLKGNTPLSLGLKYRHPECVSILIRRGYSLLEDCIVNVDTTIKKGIITSIEVYLGNDLVRDLSITLEDFILNGRR